MSFLLPLWLWAAAAAAVPVAIHLLSRGRGRVISVGTVRFLPAAHSHRLRRLRPSGLMRLLLRVALLGCLAIALAAPRYWSPLTARAGEQWVLVDPGLLAERQRLEASASEAFRRLDEIDSEHRYLLAPGIPAWDSRGEQPLRHSTQKGGSLDLWSLVAQAAADVPPQADLEIFAFDRVDALRGERPDLGRPFTWWAVTDPEPNRWIQRAVRVEDGIRATIGTSDATGTRYVSITMSTDEEDVSELQQASTTQGEALDLADGGSYPADDHTSVPRSQPPLRASILAEESRSAGAATVRQATEAVAAHLGRPLVLTSTRSAEPTEPQDLVVELGPRQRAVMPATVRLIESPPPGRPCHQVAFIADLPDPWLELQRCSEEPAGLARWRDGWGRPLLSVVAPGQSPSQMTTYQWHGRLDPAWSNLADASLPHLLLQLIAPGDASTNSSRREVSDRSAAAAGQSRPRSSSASERVSAGVPERAPAAPDPLLERIAWIAVALLFLLDRLLVRGPVTPPSDVGREIPMTPGGRSQ